MPSTIVAITQSDLSTLLEDIYSLADNQNIFFYDKEFSNNEILTLRPSSLSNSVFISYLATEALYNEDSSVVYLSDESGSYKKFTLLQKYIASPAPTP